MPPARPQLASLVDDFARHGSQVAVVATQGLRRRVTTYAQLERLSRRFAAALTDRLIVPGDRVILWGENSAEWIAAFFGCLLRGVLAVPLDSASHPDFVNRVQHEVSPKLIVCDEQKLGALNAPSALTFDSFSERLPERCEGALPGLSAADPLQIVFTSGTTGEPKGIVHSHRNVLASLLPIEAELQKYLKYERPFHPIRFLHTLPLSHVFGQFLGLWIPALLAAEVHFANRVVASETITRIRQDRISVLIAVPRVLTLLEAELRLRFPDLEQRIARAAGMKILHRWWHFRKMHSLFGWKFWAFICGGASLPESQERFWNAMGFALIQGYGMTETTALISLNHPFHPARGSVGQVLPGRQVRLSDDGEVLVRGETISNSVWQNHGFQTIESEWLATGDLAAFDDQGNLKFRGRKKDVIVTSAGLNIYPEDLTVALSRQPGVRAAAVIETQGPSGPEPLAVLVLDPIAEAAEAVAQANHELAAFQQIGRWTIWPEPDFPRTSTGKILTREVSKRVESGAIALPHQDDGMLDSLGRVELQARLEHQYGVILDDAAVQKVQTGEEMRQLLVDSEPAMAIRKTEHVFPRWVLHPAVQVMRSVFLELIAMPLVRFLAAPKVSNRLPTWPGEPVLIVANHITAYDAALLLYALPGTMRRRVAIAMAGEMVADLRHGRNQGSWFINLVAPAGYVLMTALFNVFPLPQYSGFRQSFAYAAEAMDRGYNVIVFPEGRRTDDGTPLPFKPGAGLLWQNLASPSLAMRIDGLGEIKATKQRWFRSGKISVSARTLLPRPTPAPITELTETLRKAVFD